MNGATRFFRKKKIDCILWLRSWSLITKWSEMALGKLFPLFIGFHVFNRARPPLNSHRVPLRSSLASKMDRRDHIKRAALSEGPLNFEWWADLYFVLPELLYYWESQLKRYYESRGCIKTQFVLNSLTLQCLPHFKSNFLFYFYFVPVDAAFKR